MRPFSTVKFLTRFSHRSRPTPAGL
jgi:hypothetical protein